LRERRREALRRIRTLVDDEALPREWLWELRDFTRAANTEGDPVPERLTGDQRTAAEVVRLALLPASS
jgi:hypothetical protein